MNLSIVVEGESDVPVCQRLAREVGFTDLRIMPQGGKAQLDKRLNGFNGASQHHPWLVLRDLDRDATCAPVWLNEAGFKPSRWMCFRIAVRQIESWLLADERLAAFLGIPVKRLPSNPDDLLDAKQFLVNLGRRSRRRSILEGLVPQEGSVTKVGPLYNALIAEFTFDLWSPSRAAQSSDSLRRGRGALRELAHRWRENSR